MSWMASIHRDERGSTLALAAIFMPVLLGAAALVLDIGVLLINRAVLQNAADAGVLAGAAYLPDAPSSAISAALQYSASNRVTISASAVTVTTRYDTNDTIIVEPQRTVPFQLARVLGVMSGNVRARAEATVGTMAHGRSVSPWGLVDTDPSRNRFGYGYGQTVTIKLWDGNNVTDANFQALSVDATGADAYRESITGGTSRTVAIGDMVDTETGAMHGPTKQGLDDRVGSNTQTFSQVVAANGDGTFTVLDWNSPRITVVPVIAGLVQCGSQARVTAFSVFFLESWELKGGVASVTGRFVNTLLPESAWMAYQGSYGARVVRLEQ